MHQGSDCNIEYKHNNQLCAVYKPTSKLIKGGEKIQY